MANLPPSNQDYMATHDIERLFETMMESLVLEKPNDPKAYLASHLSQHAALSYQDTLALLDSFRQISSATSPHLASLQIIEIACALLKCERASLFLYDSGHKLLKMVVGKDAQGIVMPHNAGCTWKVFTSNSIINVHNAYSDPDFDASVDICTGFKTETILGAPVKNTSGETIGVLLGINKRNANFSYKDEGIIAYLASQAGVVIQNSIFYQKAVNNENKAKALLHFIRKVNTGTPGQSLAVELVRKAKDLLQADTCTIFMIDYLREQVIPIASEAGHDFRLSLHTGILGKVAKSGQSVNTNHQDPDFSKEFDELLNYNTESVLTVPIKGREKIVGLIQITNKHSDSMFGDLKIISQFDEDDVELLETFSEVLGGKLEKLFITLGVGIEGAEEHAVHFKSGFGKGKEKEKPLPEGAIRESDEEEESKS